MPRGDNPNSRANLIPVTRRTKKEQRAMANEDTDNTLKENYESAAKKLLDFSALNPLLYFRFDKKHLTITYPDMESLFSRHLDNDI